MQSSTPPHSSATPSPAAMPHHANGAGRAPKKAQQPAAADPHKFGRVDEHGAVFVFRDGEEQQIASWQAGTPEEGLAHYSQRFDDIVTEVVLLENRLKAHPEDAADLKRTAATLRDSLRTTAAIGDFAALEQRLIDFDQAAADAAEQAKTAKAQRRADAIAKKEALAAEAEELAENSTEWKQAGDRIRAILEEWRSIRGIDRATDDELWKRYSRARDGFNRRRGAHFAELDRNRATARKTKETLVERAEALQDSTDWNETARAYRDLMQEWKAAGRAPREVDDQLWSRFRAAQDHFFGARDALNAERDREYEANAQAKDALIAEYNEQIRPEHGMQKAKAKLRELQDKWEEIGYVPRGRVSEYENKISALERRVADAEEAIWRKSDPAAQEKVHQFQEKADELHRQAEKAEEQGDNTAAQQLREQAAQWQEFADVAARAIND